MDGLIGGRKGKKRVVNGLSAEARRITATAESQRVPCALPPIPRTELGLLSKEILFFLIDLALARDEVYFFKGDDLGFVPKFVAGPEDEEGWDRDVGGDERVRLERDEGVVTFEEGDDPRGDEGKV